MVRLDWPDARLTSICQIIITSRPTQIILPADGGSKLLKLPGENEMTRQWNLRLVYNHDSTVQHATTRLLLLLTWLRAPKHRCRQPVVQMPRCQCGRLYSGYVCPSSAVHTASTHTHTHTYTSSTEWQISHRQRYSGFIFWSLVFITKRVVFSCPPLFLGGPDLTSGRLNYPQNVCIYVCVFVPQTIPFGAPTLLVGRQEGHLACRSRQVLSFAEFGLTWGDLWKSWEGDRRSGVVPAATPPSDPSDVRRPSQSLGPSGVDSARACVSLRYVD